MVLSGRLVQAAQASRALLVADLHQRLGDVVDILDVHPAGDIAMLRPVPAAANSRTDRSLASSSCQ
jgi:hypothetical protein